MIDSNRSAPSARASLTTARIHLYPGAQETISSAQGCPLVTRGHGSGLGTQLRGATETPRHNYLHRLAQTCKYHVWCPSISPPYAIWVPPHLVVLIEDTRRSVRTFTRLPLLLASALYLRCVDGAIVVTSTTNLVRSLSELDNRNSTATPHVRMSPTVISLDT